MVIKKVQESKNFNEHVSGLECAFQPFTPLHQNAYSPFRSLYISKDDEGENLFNNQEFLQLVIISFNLMTLMFEFLPPNLIIEFQSFSHYYGFLAAY